MNTSDPQSHETQSPDDGGTGSDRARDRVDPIDPVDPVDQKLVAYLDGELSDAETVKIESELAESAEMRTRLHELQAAWDMLDELPRSEPSRDFLKSTLEMVVTSARPRKRYWYRWPLRALAVTAAFVAAAFLAFYLVRGVQNAPHRDFVANLDFYENVDLYTVIQEENGNEVGFLKQLSGNELLGDLAKSARSETRPVATQVSNQKRLEQLSNIDAAMLRSAKDRYQQRPEASQERLKAIHERIQSHPDRVELMSTLNAYYDWFKSLKLSDQSELRQLNQDARVSRIVEIREAQLDREFGRIGKTALPDKDKDTLIAWREVFLERQEDQIGRWLKSRREREERETRWAWFAFDHGRNEGIGFWAVARYDRDYAIKLINQSALAELRTQLSPEALSILDDQPTIEEQKWLVCRWIMSSVRESRDRRDRRRGDRRDDDDRSDRHRDDDDQRKDRGHEDGDRNGRHGRNDEDDGRGGLDQRFFFNPNL